MIKFIILTIGCLVLLVSAASSQEVIIRDFPIGVAGSVADDFFQPFRGELKAVVDTLMKYPQTIAVVTGGADGERYRLANDAKNPALALGRAHALRNYLMSEFGADSSRMIIRSEDVREKGGQYRFAGVRVADALTDMETRVMNLNGRLDTLAARPPVEKHFTEIKEVAVEPIENWRLQFGVGGTTSPFGGIPIVTSALIYKDFVYVEGELGHTFWNNSFRFEDEGEVMDLQCKRRLIGGQVIVYPFDNMMVGIVGGWVRIEQISQEFYEYVKLSEGPTFGLRATPFEFLSITGVYNPSKHRIVDQERSLSKNGQFLLSAMAHMEFGGKK